MSGAQEEGGEGERPVLLRWRGYAITQLQLVNPFASAPTDNASQQPKFDENKEHPQEEPEQNEAESATGFELELTEEWRERAKSTYARLRDRRKRLKKQEVKESSYERVRQLEDELQHGFDLALAQLKAQEATDSVAS